MAPLLSSEIVLVAPVRRSSLGGQSERATAMQWADYYAARIGFLLSWSMP